MGRRLQQYATDDITVTFDPTRCIHVGECLRRLPGVFDRNQRRWIRLEGATAEEVARVVERCPSGALQYHFADGRDEEPPAGLTVRATRNGPLYVRGTVVLETEEGEHVVTATRLALCRCGQTQNGPFCDGSHRTAGFRTDR